MLAVAGAVKKKAEKPGTEFMLALAMAQVILAERLAATPSAVPGVCRVEWRARGGRRRDDALFFFSSRRRHTRSLRDWSSDVCSSDLRGVIRANGPDEFVAAFDR